MQEMLKEKLWTYIVQNNADLMLNLQQDFSVTGYLEQKVFNVQPLASQLLAENKPGYIIEELCMEELTKDLRPSKFNYIHSVLEDEFGQNFLRIKESGLLTYEIVNLISESETVFETLGFTQVNEQYRMLRYAIAGTIRQYMESK
ncbi:MAG: DUF1896 domain-containing protein [Prolixibacteraceae bacterium]|jgi:hypothetical protein|nr:DUF1896 domain-containing protein [Prolixibacteraceae bacterium]